MLCGRMLVSLYYDIPVLAWRAWYPGLAARLALGM